MRRVALSLVSIVALVSSASAADIYSQPIGGGLKDIPVVVPINTWAGFYIGVNGGGAWSDHERDVRVFDTLTPPPPPSNGVDSFGVFRGPSPSGGFGGVQAGYNWQWGNFVAGLEGDIQGAGISDSTTTIIPTDTPLIAGTARVSSALDWFGTIRGRLGYSFGNVLVYGTGGFAAGGIRDRALFVSSDHPNDGGPSRVFDLKDGETATGFTVGGGLEYAFSPAWSIKAEYQFISLSPERLTNFEAGITSPVRTLRSTDFDHDFNTVRIGINYHFHEYAALPLK